MADRARLLEVAQVFLKLGTIAFGGPAAHIGMIHDEVVRRREWLSDQEILDLLGAHRAGWHGLIIGGALIGFLAFALH